MSDDLIGALAAKLEAEVALADRTMPGSEAVANDGPLTSRTILVKGAPGSEDLAEAKALAGPDGAAASKAMDALGLSEGGILSVVSRPVEGASDAQVIERLALLIEAVDPARIVALDAQAAADLWTVAGVEPADFGVAVSWWGRTLLAVDGLEASLGDEDRKRRVWGQLKSLASPGHLGG